ncbi:MAG TPA: DedA family protein [Halanaerobiales bacterium]|nr:DedA family protein [Halanaerobiales bacterium]
MQNIILDIINHYGYIGVFLLIAIENIFPPIPSEVILTFGGFMTTFTDMNVWGVIIAATLGSVIGAVILYSLGRILSPERLENLFDSKFGKMMHLKREDVQKAESWFAEYGTKAVFLCRFVPIVRSLISIPAGMAKMEWFKFLPLTITGTFIWNLVLVHLGRFAGEAWESIVSYINIYSKIVLAILIIIILVFAIIFVKKRFIEKKE